MTAIDERTATYELAEFAAGLSFDDIPAPCLDHAKLLVLDTLGCGLLGSGLAASTTLTTTLVAVDQSRTCTVWGTDARLSAPHAAMANATSVHGFELDDVGSGQHNGSVVLTSILAVAEWMGRPFSGRELLTSFVLACELVARIQACAGRRPHVKVGFHGPSVMGTFAAAAAAGRALGLTTDQLVDALGHAAQQACGLMGTQHGGMGKRMLAGKAAQSGTLAALLAAHGFTNAPRLLEEEYGGFFTTFAGGVASHDPDQLTRELGTDWRTPASKVKMWACRVPIHASLEALAELRRSAGVRADDIASVAIGLDEGAYKAVGFPWQGTSVASAQLNMQYCAAVLILDGDVFVPQFTPERLRAEDVNALARKVTTFHDVDLDTGDSFLRQSRVRVTLVDGQELVADGEARGGQRSPITPDDVVAKFHKMAAHSPVSVDAQEIVRLVDGLSDLPDVGPLLTALV